MLVSSQNLLFLVETSIECQQISTYFQHNRSIVLTDSTSTKTPTLVLNMLSYRCFKISITTYFNQHRSFYAILLSSTLRFTPVQTFIRLSERQDFIFYNFIIKTVYNVPVGRFMFIVVDFQKPIENGLQQSGVRTKTRQ